MRIDNLEAKIYLTEASQENWSVRTLERNIKTSIPIAYYPQNNFK
jgi:predicted nuclease of restriction endonuclease-like (RecB) superfamily